MNLNKSEEVEIGRNEDYNSNFKDIIHTCNLLLWMHYNIRAGTDCGWVFSNMDGQPSDRGWHCDHYCPRKESSCKSNSNFRLVHFIFYWVFLFCCLIFFTGFRCLNTYHFFLRLPLPLEHMYDHGLALNPHSHAGQNAVALPPEMGIAYDVSSEISPPTQYTKLCCFLVHVVLSAKKYTV
jgi:hypothetical protein